LPIGFGVVAVAPGFPGGDFFDQGLFLVSPEFWPSLGSSGEPERLHLIRVLSSNDEICEAVA